MKWARSASSICIRDEWLSQTLNMKKKTVCHLCTKMFTISSPTPCTKGEHNRLVSPLQAPEVPNFSLHNLQEDYWSSWLHNMAEICRFLWLLFLLRHVVLDIIWYYSWRQQMPLCWFRTHTYHTHTLQNSTVQKYRSSTYEDTFFRVFLMPSVKWLVLL